MSVTSGLRISTLATYALFLPLAIACATKPAPVGEGIDREVRIAELEAAIRNDRQRIEILLSEEREADAAPLHQDRELQAIAHRLPRLDRELSALRARSKDGQPVLESP